MPKPHPWLIPLQPQRRAAPGLEQVIWRHLPPLALWGTVMPLVVIAFLRLSGADNAAPAQQRSEQLAEFALLGGMFTLWTLLLVVALGCVIVRVMKGPGYVADAYRLPERPGDDSPLN